MGKFKLKETSLPTELMSPAVFQKPDAGQPELLRTDPNEAEESSTLAGSDITPG